MTIKQDRMSEKVQAILSELILREVSDPRLQNITITEVKLDPELMFADVYVNALGDESRQDEVLSGLESANGYLRRELGKRVRLRTVPELHFFWDETLEQGERINQLLENLHIPDSDDDFDDDDDDFFDDEDEFYDDDDFDDDELD